MRRYERTCQQSIKTNFNNKFTFGFINLNETVNIELLGSRFHQKTKIQ